MTDAVHDMEASETSYTSDQYNTDTPPPPLIFFVSPALHTR